MSQIPEALRYTKEHEWVAVTPDPKRLRMGITDFAQSALGDIVYVQLPKVGDLLVAGKVCGEVESTKSVSEIYAPLTGQWWQLMSRLPQLLRFSTLIPMATAGSQRSRLQWNQPTFFQRASTPNLPLDLRFTGL